MKKLRHRHPMYSLHLYSVVRLFSAGDWQWCR